MVYSRNATAKDYGFSFNTSGAANRGGDNISYRAGIDKFDPAPANPILVNGV
jgi:hypothetical protein